MKHLFIYLLVPFLMFSCGRPAEDISNDSPDLGGGGSQSTQGVYVLGKVRPFQIFWKDGKYTDYNTSSFTKEIRTFYIDETKSRHLLLLQDLGGLNNINYRAFYRKDNNNEVEINPNGYNNNILDMKKIGSDIYFTGFEENQNNGDLKGFVWKNTEKLYPLTVPGVNVTQVAGVNLTEQNNSLYVGGWIKPQNKGWELCIWKDGSVWKRLNTDFGYAAAPNRSVKVIFDGPDYYVFANAMINTMQFIFKNGVDITNSINPNTKYTFWDMTILNHEIILVGENRDNNPSVPLIWRNNNITKLPLQSGDNYGSALSLFIDQNDIYVCGSSGRSPVYWKNGNINLLQTDVDKEGLGEKIQIVH